MILEFTRSEVLEISYYLRAFCCGAPWEYPDSEINSVRALTKNISSQYNNIEYSGPDDEVIYVKIELNLNQAYDAQYYLGVVQALKLAPELNFPKIKDLRSLIMKFIEAEEETIDWENCNTLLQKSPSTL